jgi:hypothetical protein
MELFPRACQVFLYCYEESFLLLVGGAAVELIIAARVVSADNTGFTTVSYQSHNRPSAQASRVLPTIVYIYLLRQMPKHKEAGPPLLNSADIFMHIVGDDGINVSLSPFEKLIEAVDVLFVFVVNLMLAIGSNISFKVVVQFLHSLDFVIVLHASVQAIQILINKSNCPLGFRRWCKTVNT